MRRTRATYAAAVVAAIVLGVVLVSVAGASRRGGGLQHVTLIGDSVATALEGDSAARRILAQGIDLDLQVAPCRRLVDKSCPPNPPSTIDVIQRLGEKAGPNVVIAVGYNDFADRYAAEIEDTLAALKAAGVKRVFWLTLRAAHRPYVGMNDEIVAAAAAHPELAVIDWNVYSRSHPDWFQDDGLHLLADGSEAMATLINKVLLGAGVALPPVRVATRSLPAARHGRRYTARLRATAGLAPYSWSLLQRAPKGLHLRASGAIDGTPRVRPGKYSFNVRVKDSSGTTATRRLTLRVTR